MINTKLLASTTSIWEENVCENFRMEKFMLFLASSCVFLSKGGAAEDNIILIWENRSNRHSELKVSLGWHTSIHSQQQHQHFPLLSWRHRFTSRGSAFYIASHFHVSSIFSLFWKFLLQARLNYGHVTKFLLFKLKFIFQWQAAATAKINLPLSRRWEISARVDEALCIGIESNGCLGSSFHLPVGIEGKS